MSEWMDAYASWAQSVKPITATVVYVFLWLWVTSARLRFRLLGARWTWRARSVAGWYGYYGSSGSGRCGRRGGCRWHSLASSGVRSGASPWSEDSPSPSSSLASS